MKLFRAIMTLLIILITALMQKKKRKKVVLIMPLCWFKLFFLIFYCENKINKNYYCKEIKSNKNHREWEIQVNSKNKTSVIHSNVLNFAKYIFFFFWFINQVIVYILKLHSVCTTLYPKLIHVRRPPPRKIIVNVSVNDDVQLKKSENAWKPGMKRESVADDPEALRTQVWIPLITLIHDCKHSQ